MYNERPKKFKLLNEVYDESEQVEIEEELMLGAVDDPLNYNQAEKEEVWKEAMEAEINSIEKNKTWELTELPKGHIAIGLKWVYKVKRDANDNGTKHKARLVAKGYVQQQGIDYEEIFAPVTRLETLIFLLAFVAKNEWQIHHLDVKFAFLNGDLEENGVCSST